MNNTVSKFMSKFIRKIARGMTNNKRLRQRLGWPCSYAARIKDKENGHILFMDRTVYCTSMYLVKCVVTRGDTRVYPLPDLPIKLVLGATHFREPQK